MWKRLLQIGRQNSFVRDPRGGMKIIVALTTPIMLLMTGSGIDVAELYRARINLQNAVDAGTLMTAKTLASTGDLATAADAGREVFLANMGTNITDAVDASIDFDMTVGDCADTPVVGTATLRKPVFFAFMRAATTDVVGIIDGTKQAAEDERLVNMTASAEVKCGGDTLEIALVLDNSGSMGSGGKLDTLRTAASDLVNTLNTAIGETSHPEPLKFSIVPFAGMVNVGPDNRDAVWMDTTGVGTHHHEYLNWDADPNAVKVGNLYQTLEGAPLTRFTLFDNLPGIDWAGCVESRPYPELTLDTEPDVSVAATMFVPTFAPDTPDNWSGSLEQEVTVTPREAICSTFKKQKPNARCKFWSDGYSGTIHPQDPSYQPRWDDDIEYDEGEFIADESYIVATQTGGTISEEWYHNNYLKDDHNFPFSLDHPKSAANTGTGADQHKRQSWTWKYFNAPEPHDVNNEQPGLPSILGVKGGPNAFCTVQQISDLSNDMGSVLSDISTMLALGSTHIQAGVAWGWKTLSPGEPFTQGRDYSVADNKKIMIVMTDGENTAYPISGSGYSTLNKAHYSTWGHSENMRIFEGFEGIGSPQPDERTHLEAAMNSHLTETCTNAKATGISIYTIAFSVADGSSVKALLEECASTDLSGAKQYYDAQNNAELIASFQSIAEQLADLAIVK